MPLKPVPVIGRHVTTAVRLPLQKKKNVTAEKRQKQRTLQRAVHVPQQSSLIRKAYRKKSRTPPAPPPPPPLPAPQKRNEPLTLMCRHMYSRAIAVHYDTVVQYNNSNTPLHRAVDENKKTMDVQGRACLAACTTATTTIFPV